MSAAAANIVTLTFESITPGSYNENLVENGFRISPNCFVSIFPDLAGFATDGNALGWLCSVFPEFSNPDYLGPRGLIFPAILGKVSSSSIVSSTRLVFCPSMLLA
jgi:hypothetical protein